MSTLTLILTCAVRARLLPQPGADVVPAAATLYCMGIEVLTGEVQGFDLAPLNKHR